MANWSLTGNTGTLQQVRHIPLPVNANTASMFEKREDDGDFEAQIRNVVEARARAAAEPVLHAAASATLALRDAIVFPTGEAAGADRLSEARRLIALGQYDEALTLVERFLKDSPGHQTATYLKAYCELHLEEPELALQTIAPLLRARPANLETEVRRLRTDISKAMVQGVVEWVAARSSAGDLPGAIERLEELLALDGEVPVYLCLRIHLLMLADRLQDAARAAAAAVPFCQGRDRSLLDGLTATIRRRLFEAAVEPARRLYRDRNYRKARKALDHIERDWHDEPMFGVFDTYLTALGGGFFSRSRTPAEVLPEGPFAAVDRLHFLLVREEVAVGKGLLRAGHAKPAVTVLSNGLLLAPHFPYLHYLMGKALFDSLLEELPEASWVDHAEHRERLAVARGHVTAARRDSEIDGVDELLEAIDDVDHTIVELREKFERQQRDIEAVVGPLLQKFGAIIEPVREGIHSPEQFRRVQAEFVTLRKALPGARRKATADHVKEALKQFEVMVEKNWQQLADIEPEVEQAEKLFALRKRLGDAVKGVQSNPGTRSLEMFRGTLQSLKTDVAAFRRETVGEEAREGADALDRNIDELLRQAADAQAATAEATKVNPLIDRFNGVMERVSGLSYYGSAADIRRELASIAVDAMKLRGELRTPQARKNVDELIDAITESMS